MVANLTTGCPHVIADITPLTLLDYPGKLACILWFNGCNMRCSYCYNADLARRWNCSTLFPANFKEKNLYEFLHVRSRFLNAIVLSGGECTLSPYLPEICNMARSMNYSIKIDTNGTNPQLIRYLVEQDLIQYIALDYKSPYRKFHSITGGSQGLFQAFDQTLSYLIAQQKISFEVRTTVHPDLLNEADIQQIINDLEMRGYQWNYYLQHYFHTDHNMHNLQNPIRRFDPSLLKSKIPIQLRNFKDQRSSVKDKSQVSCFL